MKDEIIEVESVDIMPYEEKNTEVACMDNLTKLMDMANTLAKSTIVPINYQNRPENVLIALEMANRMNVPIMMVMQNLYVIQGKPSFSGSSIGAMLKASNQFKNVELNYVGKEGQDDYGCYVSAISTKTGKALKGGTVTVGIAKREGWFAKSGSKWQTMPEIMLAYRAYAWFGRVYAPELMMGLQSTDEVEDATQDTVEVINPYENK